MVERYLSEPVLTDLADNEMVFLGGPRQVGKTTLAKDILAPHFNNPCILNWDSRTDRRKIINAAWPGGTDLVVIDEFHKYRKWKSHMKGIYDTQKEKHRFVLTGSARMDVFRRGGDSLQGRYHYFRLHPFSLPELEHLKNAFEPLTELGIPRNASTSSLASIEHFGGFPEPFFRQNERFLRRWHNEKIERMFTEDIQSIEIVRDLGSMRLLADLLPGKVGSLLSTNALREDLDVSFKAVAHWLDILETFYYHFRIYPFTSKNIRSLKKEPKLYLWDWSEIADESRRFENIIASHLLKFVHYLHDFEGYRTGLWFLRDVEKNEVDFLVTAGSSPWFAVEAKVADTKPASPLRLFKRKWGIPWCYQVVKTSGIDSLTEGIRVISADRFLLSLV